MVSERPAGEALKPEDTLANSARLLCNLVDLPDGSARGFDPWGDGRDTIFAVRRNGQVHVYRNQCPHIDGAPLPWRKDAYLNREASRIVCAAHGAQFDIESGICLLGPCLGQSLQALPHRVDSAGRLLLVLCIATNAE